LGKFPANREINREDHERAAQGGDTNPANANLNRPPGKLP